VKIFYPLLLIIVISLVLYFVVGIHVLLILGLVLILIAYLMIAFVLASLSIVHSTNKQRLKSGVYIAKFTLRGWTFNYYRDIDDVEYYKAPGMVSVIMKGFNKFQVICR
jgi:hypothetical protein